MINLQVKKWQYLIDTAKRLLLKTILNNLNLTKHPLRENTKFFVTLTDF